MNKRGIGFGFQTSQAERKQLVGNLAYDRYLNKHLIVRDDSVQRENVWADIAGKQESFLSHLRIKNKFLTKALINNLYSKNYYNEKSN